MSFFGEPILFRTLRGAALTAGLLVAAAATPARAATIDFTVNEGATVEANGSFSYSSADPVIHYGDLSAFSLIIGLATYDLAFALASTNYSYFAFDTVG
ncbi:MAG: hypothetical protein WAN51_13645 [Alphaproteobacteria bacterium]